MITPYLNYSGNCEAAFKYYEKHLGGKTDMMMRYADAPPEMTANTRSLGPLSRAISAIRLAPSTPRSSGTGWPLA